MKLDYFDLLDKEDLHGLETFLHIHHPNEEINGQTLLYWATHQNNIAFVKLLVSQGANVNYRDDLGRTPLQIACYFGFTEIVAFLLESGANTEGCLEQATNGWAEQTHEEIVNLLK